MATSVTTANIEVPNLDGAGNPIDYGAFAKALAALTVDNRYNIMPLYAYDNNGNYVGQSTIILVFLLSANNQQALTQYTNFKNSQAAGTIMNVWYSTQTLGA
jgi:hypothetical protein